jgi:hypothetical protein
VKVLPGKRYTRQQLAEAIDQSTADELKLQGYVLQYDALSQTYGVVPWYEAASGAEFGTFRPDNRGGTGTFAPIDPIKKRTPMQRVDSLMLRFIDDCKKTGTVPGLDDARISHILGESWKAGRNEVTAEVIRRVAASFLAKAEREHEAKLAKQITRHED